MSDFLRAHIIEAFNKGVRFDGRGFEEYRKISIKDNVSANSEGSCEVMLGKTHVIAGIKVDITEPFPDMPDEGVLVVNLILSPIASGEFSIGPPSPLATELSRIIDRGIRESKAIDLKKLCIDPGKQVYAIFIDIVVINDDGNLIDASMIASMRALKLARIPNIVDGKLDYKHRGSKKIPLVHEPIAVSIYKIANNIFVDATREERDFSDVVFHIIIREDGKVCALQKGGDVGIDVRDIAKILKLAKEKDLELRKYIIIKEDSYKI